MINELKKILLKPYNQQMDEYRAYKAKFDELQKDIIHDDSDKEYRRMKSDLKKEYKNPKGDSKKEYEDKIHEIMVEYKKALDAFQDNYEKYNIMKSKLASWNIYETKLKMEKINQATNIEELGLTEEEARQMCYENGIDYIELNN